MACSPTLPTFLLVPGAWHRPWVFDLLRNNLHARGFPTEAVALAGVGSSDPNVGLDDDTAAVRSELQKLVDAGKDVVVVPHSYGGIPVSNAVKGLNQKDRAEAGGVIMVVYMVAFAVAAGAGLTEGAALPPWWDIKDGFISPLDAVQIFYGDVEPSLAAKAVDALLPQPLKTLKDKSDFEPWKNDFEVGYVFAEQDQAIPLGLQKLMASQFPEGSFTASLASSHSPFLSMPGALGDALQKAAEAAIAKKTA